MKIIYLFFALFVCASLYGQKLIIPDSTVIQEIRISPSDAFGGTVSELLDSVIYIKLEKPSKDWVGNLHNYYIINDKLVLSDGLIKGDMWLYNLTGQFIKKLNVPSDIVRNNTIFYNVDNTYLYLSDIYSEKVNSDGVITDGIKFSLNGDILEEFPLRHKKYKGKKLLIEGTVRFDKDEFWFSRPQRAYKEANNVILYQKITSEEILPLLCIDTTDRDYSKIKIHNMNQFFTSFAKDVNYLYYSNPFTYEVAEVSKGGLNKVYKFILPLKNTASLEVYDNETYNNNKFNFFKANSDLVVAIDNINRYKEYLLFNFNRGLKGRFAYSLTNDELINLAQIVPDQSNDYLPIFSSINPHIVSDGTYLYSIIYSNDVNACINEFYKGKVVPDKIKNLSKFNNAILVRFKLK